MKLSELEQLDEEEFFFAIEELWENALLESLHKREARYGISSGEAYARLKDGLLVETKDMLDWAHEFKTAKREGLI